MGKETIFKKPFKTVCKWMGGISVDRSKSNNVVSQSVDQFSNNDELILIVPPAGTRKRVTKWKTGFYYIAYHANVPILLSYLDYGRKVGGIGPLFYPTGDYQADIVKIMAFYSNVSGKYPEKSIHSNS